MTTNKTITPRSRRRGPLVFLPLLLLAFVGGYYVFGWFSARSSAAAARAELLREVDDELAKEPVDTSALSRLVARIDKLEDHTSAADLLAAQARIELVRGRPERAFDLFSSVGNQPEASEADRRLLTAILLRRHEAGGTDKAMTEGWLRDAATRALAIAERTGNTNDWFVAWQASVRLDDADAVKRCREQLAAIDAESREARLAAAAAAFRADGPADVLYALRGEFTVVPIELAVMVAMAQLQAGETAAAVTEIEALLNRAPGLIGVRVAAAIVFHVCVLNSQDDAGKQRWRPRRDAQLDWLLENAPPDDKRRETWSQMKQQ
ncbi:MAG: hypothetical protein H6838_16520 [Planctomycetes bacterium]|nr:hypothetical protein [Planctomycetota bacterium]